LAPDEPSELGQTINEITERATLIVREEIELARAEVEEKVRSLVKGAVVAAAAGFFALMGLVLMLNGFSWFFYVNVFSADGGNIFWGFLIVAGTLFLLGALAGWLASRAFKAGSPPTPQMAIDEAKLIRETVEASAGIGEGAPAQPPAVMGQAVPARPAPPAGGPATGGPAPGSTAPGPGAPGSPASGSAPGPEERP
jgi:Putative Actinobacterial Holin-X, holin superfamily III